eukprot:scaffold2012_cov228-Pinguiococcus_pyrenoidosus.AAC.8
MDCWRLSICLAVRHAIYTRDKGEAETALSKAMIYVYPPSGALSAGSSSGSPSQPLSVPSDSVSSLRSGCSSVIGRVEGKRKYATRVVHKRKTESTRAENANGLPQSSSVQLGASVSGTSFSSTLLKTGPSVAPAVSAQKNMELRVSSASGPCGPNEARIAGKPDGEKVKGAPGSSTNPTLKLASPAISVPLAPRRCGRDSSIASGQPRNTFEIAPVERRIPEPALSTSRLRSRCLAKVGPRNAKVMYDSATHDVHTITTSVSTEGARAWQSADGSSPSASASSAGPPSSAFRAAYLASFFLCDPLHAATQPSCSGGKISSATPRASTARRAWMTFVHRNPQYW